MEIPEAHLSFPNEKDMQLKVMIVGLVILGLIVAESGAMPAGSVSEAEARADPETAERAEQTNAEEARISDACLKSLLSRKAFFVDHGFQYLPPSRVLTVDGLYLSFEGVAVMASHIRELCCKHPDNDVSLWREFLSFKPSHGANQASPRTSYSQASPDATHGSPVSNHHNLREESTQTTPFVGHRYPSCKNSARDNAAN
ncbi:hypothetical protein HPB49_023359 [Dermacentor silvarum]|uniref:Uncharacterized protein n=1 Tax=Dermacentor silvarum TaxID=543639 RepID=A0ACB8D8F4_DERSI|nr:hypothetical protein HPB49_023359 [Dermacentor silvarum]